MNAFARVAAAALSLALPLAAADPPQQASGKFHGKDWYFEAMGAYAFPSEVGMDDEQGVRIAVSNGSFPAAAIDRFHDRQHVIDTDFKDEETLVVYFDFAKNGAYRGMSYYFGSGDGCGFCYDGAVASTVKLAGGRAKGKISLPEKPGEAHWSLEIDVPVAATDFGAPLPADGGEPAKAYAAYHAALASDDPETVKKFYTEATQADWAEDRDGILQSYRKDHPDKSYRFLRGWTRGDGALLLLEGETSYFRATSEVLMVREKGTWRVDAEILKVKLGE
jgi:hypothetical protein